jgi:hypothetical protein
MTWHVYGIFADRRLQYVGCTANMKKRRARHSIDTMAGRRFTMRVLASAQTEADARRIETEMIATKQPPLNHTHNPARRQVVTLVPVLRPSMAGGMVPTTMRLSEGTMHPDEAMRVWRNSALELPEKIALMPGWSLGRAYFIFGPPFDR